MDKRVGVIGASGYIGSKLSVEYERRGWTVVRFSRSLRGSGWLECTTQNIKRLDVLVNLAGERIDQRWTQRKKQELYDSRVGVTKDLTRKFKRMSPQDRPKVWVNASAVGVYGDRGDQVLSEGTSGGVGYLAELCRDWEQAASLCELEGVRQVFPRIGVVFGEESSAWQKIKRPFSLCLGGTLGNGKQWMPWVHVQDLVNALIFISEKPSISGPCNIVAPHPETNETLTEMLAKRHGKPGFFHVPEWVLKGVLGELAGMLLASHRVHPMRLNEAGFQWQFPDLQSAVTDLMK